MLAEWKCEFSEDLFYAWGGMPVAEIIATLNEKHGLNMPVEDVSRRKEGFYLEILPQLRAVPEVLEHIEASHGKIPPRRQRAPARRGGIAGARYRSRQ